MKERIKQPPAILISHLTTEAREGYGDAWRAATYVTDPIRKQLEKDIQSLIDAVIHSEFPTTIQGSAINSRDECLSNIRAMRKLLRYLP